MAFLGVVIPLTDLLIQLSKYQGLPLYEVELLNDGTVLRNVVCIESEVHFFQYLRGIL